MDRPTVGIIAASGDLFARELFAHLSDRYHIEYLDGPDPYVDLLWCDWADQSLVQLSRQASMPPLVARFHSYELFTTCPDQVRWDRVEALVFVAEHIRRRARPRVGLREDQIHLIPNGVDLDCFRLDDPGPRTRLAWAGRLAPNKGVDLLPHLLLAAREVNPAFTLHVAGAFEDARSEAAFRHLVASTGLTEAIELCGQLPHEVMPDWYRRHGFVMSTSIWESFQYAVAEGAACGLVPLVRAWEGADDLYDERFHLWSSVRQLQEHLARLLALDDEAFAQKGRAARDLVTQRYRRERQVEATAQVIDGVLARGAHTARRPRPLHPVEVCPPIVHPPRLSAAMILKNEQARLPACLESIRDVVDEIVVVDAGSTDRTCEIAAAFGARIFHHPWQLDFSLHRNQSLDYATGDWVLIIDGDEQLHAGNLRRVLARCHADDAIDALSVRVDAMTEGGLAEQLEAIRVFRRTKGRYRFPVHNQLVGVTCAVPTSAVITAWYVGTLEQKAARSLPLLHALTEQQETRAHAAFFLAKTYRALRRFAEVQHWTAECQRLVADAPGYATFWLWKIEAALVLEGMTAAEQVLAQAQRHHPDFDELHRYRAAFSLFRWQEKALLPNAYRAGSVMGDRFALNIPAAAHALGLPLEFRAKMPEQEGPLAREEGAPEKALDSGGGGVDYGRTKPGGMPLWPRHATYREVERVLRGHQELVLRCVCRRRRGVSTRRAGQRHCALHPGGHRRRQPQPYGGLVGGGRGRAMLESLSTCRQQLAVIALCVGSYGCDEFSLDDCFQRGQVPAPWDSASQSVRVDLAGLIDAADGRYTLHLGPALLGAGRPGGYAFPLTLNADAVTSQPVGDFIPEERYCGHRFSLPIHMVIRADAAEVPWKLINAEAMYHARSLYIVFDFEVATESGAAIMSGDMMIHVGGTNTGTTFFSAPDVAKGLVGQLLSEQECAPVPVEEC